MTNYVVCLKCFPAMCNCPPEQQIAPPRPFPGPTPKMTKAEVAQLVIEERFYQDRKHGTITENPHTIGGWILLVESELHEAKLALIKGGVGRNSVMHELIQVAATAMAAVEQHGLDPEGQRL